MATVNELVFKILVDSKTGEAKIKNFGGVVDQASKQVNQSVGRMRSGFERVAMAGQKVFFAFQGMRMLTAPINKLIDAAGAQEKAEKKVAQAVRSTGQAAGYAADELKIMASDLQSVTTFGDEEILNQVTAQLLTFTNITGEQFAQTQEAALNLSTVLDGDLKSASLQLGKALNDPVSNLSQLSRSGIQFSAAQEKVIKSLWETGRQAEAQSIILEELNKQYGGQARAMAETASGQMKQFSNILGDIQEAFGRLIQQALLPMMAALKPLIEGIANLSPAIINLIGVTATLTVVGWKVVPMIKGISTATKVLGVSIKGALGWIGALISIAALLYTAWASNLGGFQEKLKVAFEYLKWFVKFGLELIKAYANNIKNVFGGIGKILMSVFKMDLDGIKEGLNQVKNAFVNSAMDTAKRLKGISVERDQNIADIHEQYAEEEKKTNEDLVQNHANSEDQKTDKSEEEIAKRRQARQQLEDYKFRTNRLSLAQYKDILNERIASAKEAYGTDHIEYLKLIDKKKKLAAEEANAQKEKLAALQDYRFKTGRMELAEYNTILDERLAAIEAEHGKESAQYLKLMDRKKKLNEDFKNKTVDTYYDDLKAQRKTGALSVDAYRAQLNERLAEARKLYGRESDLYRQLAEEKKDIEDDLNESVLDIWRERVDSTQNILDNFGRMEQERRQQEAERKRQDLAMELQRRRKVLQADLQAGNISEKEYKKRRKRLNQYEKNQTEKIEKEAKKRSLIEKTAALFRAGVNTAEMAIKAYNALVGIPLVGPMLGAAAAAAALRFGGQHIANIKAQKFAKGGRVEEPTMGLVGEKGEPEIIAPEKDFIQIVNQLRAEGAFGESNLGAAIDKLAGAVQSLTGGLKNVFTFDAAGISTPNNISGSTGSEKSIMPLLQRISTQIENLQLSAELDSEELAIVVSGGQSGLQNLEF